MIRATLSLFLTLSVLCAPLISLAQVTEVDDIDPAAISKSPLLCEEFFGEKPLEAALFLSAESVAPGIPATFTAQVTNIARGPMVDTTLVASIVRLGVDGAPLQIGDEIIVADSISFAGDETQQFEFTWVAPASLGAGDYLVTLHSYQGNNWHYQTPIGTLALPFVPSDTEPVASIASSGLTYDGQALPVAGARVDNTSGVFAITLLNPTSEAVQIPLEWATYTGDEVSPTKIAELISIAPNSEFTATYTAEASDAEYAKVTATALVSGVSHTATAHVAKSGWVDASSFGLSTFPFAAGEEVTVLTCASAQSPVPMVNIHLGIKDRTGALVHEVDYFGPVTAVNGGYGDVFTPSASYDYLTLERTVRVDGNVLEVSSIVFDCAAISDSNCSQAEAGTDVVTPAPANTLILFVGGVIIALFCLIVFVYFFRRRGPSGSVPPSAPPSVPSITLSILLLMFSLGFNPVPADAATCATPGEANSVMNALEYNAARSACVTNGYTELVESGREDSIPANIANPGPGTCSVIMPSPRGATTYTYILLSVPSCGAPQTNTAPSAPTISGPSSGQVNTPYSFTVSGTDADGDQVRYGLDSNFDGLIDAWLPASGRVNSGVSQNLSRQWSTAGGYSFRVLTEDAQGARSPFTTHSITIGAPPVTAGLSVDVKVNGSDSAITVAAGTPLLVAWTSSAANSCGIFGSGTNNPIMTSGSQTVSAAVTGSYIVSCSDGVDTSVDSVTVTVTPPPPPVGTCTLGPEVAAESGPTDMFAGSPPCQPVDDLASYTTPSCPVGATTGTVVSTGAIVGAGFCATRQIQASQCFGAAYVRTCNGTVLPPPTNTPPNPPTIQGPAIGEPNTTYQFIVTGIDIDNDQIRYGVDYDGNGTVDAWLPASGRVNSGVPQTISRLWPTTGPTSFRVLTQDASGAVSSWSTHFIMINNVVAACTWEYEAATDDFSPASGNTNMTCPANAGSYCNASITSALDGQPAPPGSPTLCLLSCSVSGWNRNTELMTKIGPGCAAPTASCSSAGVLYTPTSDAEYNAARQSCQDLGYTELIDSGVEDAQPGFFSNPVPDGACGVIFADTRGAIMYRYVIYSVPACAVPLPPELPNLTVSIGQVTESTDTDPTAFDAASGEYNSVIVSFQVRNDNVAAISVPVPYSLTVSTVDGTYTRTVTGTVGGGMAAGAVSNLQASFSDVPFGELRYFLHVDPSDVIAERNNSDNTAERTAVVPPPPPTLELSVTPATIVRAGTMVTLEWEVNATYPMNCEISGPAFTTYTFDPSVAGSSGSRQAGPITAQSNYTLTCTEPVTNTTFPGVDIRIETVGTVEEI